MNHIPLAREADCELYLFGGLRDLAEFLVKFSPVIWSFVDHIRKTAHNYEGGWISKAILSLNMKRKICLPNFLGIDVIRRMGGMINEHYAKDEPVIWTVSIHDTENTRAVDCRSYLPSC